MPVVGIKAKRRARSPTCPPKCTMPVVGIKAKLAEAAVKVAVQVYHACRWNQGKTRGRSPICRPKVYHACRWNQGKTVVLRRKAGPKCTMPVVGIKAKRGEAVSVAGFQCTMPVVGIKAKLLVQVAAGLQSVPCLSLESRQNSATTCLVFGLSVPCLSLESRQNDGRGRFADV